MSTSAEDLTIRSALVADDPMKPRHGGGTPSSFWLVVGWTMIGAAATIAVSYIVFISVMAAQA